MPGTNQFLPFAVGAGANTLTPTSYAALTTLLSSGFSAGVAPSAQFNTALRQATTAAAGVAQFIANQGTNVNDDGSAANFAAGLLTALQTVVNGRPGHTYANPDWLWLDRAQGLVLQFGVVLGLAASATTSVTFPIAFSAVPLISGAMPNSTTAFAMSAESATTTGLVVRNGNSSSAVSGAWFAIGKV